MTIMQNDPTYSARVQQSARIADKAANRATEEYEKEAATERERHRQAMKKITDRWSARLESARNEHAAEMARARQQFEARSNG